MRKLGIVMIIITVLGMIYLAENSNAVSTTLSWEGKRFTANYDSSGSISVVDSAFGRSSVLKFNKYANYYAQVVFPFKDMGAVDNLVLEVDFYGDLVRSWSWAPQLRIEWPSTGDYSFIQKKSSFNGRYGISDTGLTSGNLYEDRWYRFRIEISFNFRIEISFNHIQPSYLPMHHVSLKVRDLTNDGSWQTIMTGTMYGYLSSASDARIILGTDRTTNYQSPGSMETYYFDRFVVSKTTKWDYVPSASGSSYSQDWVITTSEKNSYQGISKTSIDGRSNVLKFNKNANYYSQAAHRFQNALNTEDEFWVFVDYKPQDINSWSWGPTLKISWDSGGYAYIKDNDMSYTYTAIKGVSRIQHRYVITTGAWNQLRIHVTKTEIEIAVIDLSAYPNPIINDNTGWNILMTGPRGSDMFGAFTVTIGTDRTTDYSSPGAKEVYYYDNFDIITGNAQSGSAIIHGYQIPNNVVKSEGNGFTSTTEEDRLFNQDGSWWAHGVKVTINDEFSSGVDVSYGDLQILLDDGSAGHLSSLFGALYQWTWDLTVTRYETYNPWMFAISNSWYSQSIHYTTSISGSETVSASFQVGLTGSSIQDASVTLEGSATNSLSISVSRPSFTVNNGALVALFAKHYFYRITGTITLNADSLLGDPTHTTYDVDTLVLRHVDLNQRQLVQTAINHPDFRGNMQAYSYYTSYDGPFGPNDEFQFQYKSTETRTVGLKLSLKIKAEVPDFDGLSIFGSITYSQSFTFSTSTAFKQIITVYGNKNPPSSFSLYRFNTFGLLLVV